MSRGVYVRTATIRQGISLGLMGNSRHLGYTHSEETRAKMQANHKGTTGYHHTGAHKQLMSKLLSGKGNGMYGRTEALNPNWQGGTSGYSWNFLSTIRERIRDRDNHTCQLCGMPEAECLRVLDVHHIDYNSKNDSWDNLISLCPPCHGTTQANRKYWQFYFMKKPTEENTNGQ